MTSCDGWRDRRSTRQPRHHPKPCTGQDVGLGAFYSIEASGGHLLNPARCAPDGRSSGRRSQGGRFVSGAEVGWSAPKRHWRCSMLFDPYAYDLTSSTRQPTAD
ncbi:MAG TPA: hypothetical protein VKT82_28005, partial [Ktedonobacterales bacterium]|nr:hypothetical protein [Ktedonobacterales bacterium]